MDQGQSAAGEEVWVVVLEHPGSIVRDGWAREPAQYEYLRRARGLAGGTWEPTSHADLLEKATLCPSLKDLQAWREGLTTGERSITVDVECAGPHLVCVGFTRIRDLVGVCVRLRGPQGEQWWPRSQLPEVLSWLYELLSDSSIPKWFHNGQAFDIPYLQYQGYEVEGYAGDTLLLQRYMFPGMDASLQGCAIFYAGVPAWKKMADQQNDDDAGDGK